MMDTKVWIKDQGKCEEAILSGEEVEVAETGYGANDFAIDFLKDSGLWDIAVEMYPSLLKKENGKNWKALNGVMLIKELMKIGRISGAGKVLSDAHLVVIAGFNLEEVKEKESQDKNILIEETLRNHLSRIDKESCMSSWYRHVRHIRGKKWIRGKVYVADAHEITVPYGEKYEGMGEVGEKKGYKLVVLMNIEKERERIIGFALGPIQASERDMLREILDRLEEEVSPVKDMIDLLILDRGYWGAEFLKSLKEGYEIDFVTRARDEELDVVKDIDGRLKMGEHRWHNRAEKRKRLGNIKVKVTGIEDLPLYDERGELVINVNAVVAYEYDEEGNPLKDEKGRERPRMIYITSLPTEKSPYRIRRYYLCRWCIENEGFRRLNQRYKIDTLAGRNLNAIRARLVFVFMVYNGVGIVDMKHSPDWQEERKKLRRRGEKGYIGGVAIIVYTKNFYLGVFSARRYAELVGKYEKSKLKEELKKSILSGMSPKEALKYLDSS